MPQIDSQSKCPLCQATKHLVPVRAVHLDLKGLPPTPDRLISLLRVFHAAGYNAILVEWEDSFPWSVDARFRSPTAYSSEEIEHFCAEAKSLGIEIIPLVQCLGHMETPLREVGYEHLREVRCRRDVLNPLAKGARDLIMAMVDDVLGRISDVRYFHLGGDEAWTFGTHPDTRNYIDQHGGGEAGRASLYLYHVEPILEKLKVRGIRPILWHDMMIHWPEDKVLRLAHCADLVVWGYGGHPDNTECHYNTRYIQRLRDVGMRLWGATSYKGTESQDSDLPDYAKREKNAIIWCEMARRFALEGLIATGWSRFNSESLQTEPIDAALDVLAYIGGIIHDGNSPPEGMKSCLKLLEKLGEKERFLSCKEVMHQLVEARAHAWEIIRHLHQQIVLESEVSVRRRGSAGPPQLLESLRETLDTLSDIGKIMCQRFAGLVDLIWIQEYFDARVIPIREQYQDLGERVKMIAATSVD